VGAALIQSRWPPIAKRESDVNLETGHGVVPGVEIDGNHAYRFSGMWHYDRPEALALAKRGLTQSLPFYALFTSPAEMTSQQSRLPAVPNYEWRIFSESDTNAVILKLAPAQSPDGASP
jgi:hypothetical protein